MTDPIAAKALAFHLRKVEIDSIRLRMSRNFTQSSIGYGDFFMSNIYF